MSFEVALMLYIIRQYWNQKQILFKVLLRWKLAFILVLNSRRSGQEGSVHSVSAVFGTIYKGQLDCVNVILFTELLQLTDTFCVLKTRIPF